MQREGVRGSLGVASKETVARVRGVRSGGGAVPAAVPDAAPLGRARQPRGCAPSAVAPVRNWALSWSFGWLLPLRRQHRPNQSRRCQKRTKRRLLLPPPRSLRAAGSLPPPPIRPFRPLQLYPGQPQTDRGGVVLGDGDGEPAVEGWAPICDPQLGAPGRSCFSFPQICKMCIYLGKACAREFFW